MTYKSRRKFSEVILALCLKTTYFITFHKYSITCIKTDETNTVGPTFDLYLFAFNRIV